jgi:acyl-CoA thioesterase I
MNTRIFTLIFTTLFLLNSAIAQSVKKQKPLKIACVGDSITFGAAIKDRKKNSYPAQIALLLGTKAIVKNFGVNSATLLKKGDKPYWKLKQYKAALAFSPDIVVIKLGTNDSKPRNWKHKAEYTANYIELIQSFQKLPSQPKVWICYPVPAYPGRWGITDKVMKEEVIPLIDDVAKASKVDIIDLYKALSGKKELFPDSVHPNAAGAKIMAETILPIITK